MKLTTIENLHHSLSQIKRLAIVYSHFLKFSLKYMLEYRFNALVRSLFVPTWQLSTFIIIHVIFLQTPTLGGWNRNEAVMLFLVFQLLYLFIYFAFLEGGVRHMMWFSVRHGEYDAVLTKPVPTQLLSMFARPSINSFLGLSVTIVLFVYHLSQTSLGINLASALAFGIMYVLSFLICYFLLSAYATLSFYFTKSQQIIEIIDKTADYSQYPMSIFPTSFQLIAFTLIPIAYMGYVPTLFLLNRGSWQVVLITVAVLIVSFFINKTAWRVGLKHYSSASS
jgi:ABC-2 type transport system permease protein